MKKKIVLAGIIVAGISSAFIAKKMFKGVDTASMDIKTNPHDDFYEYANGTWCKNNPVPASEARWTSFNVLAERNNLMLKNILETAANDKGAAPGSARQKVGDFYKMAMDSTTLNNGGSPVFEDFNLIQKIANKDDLIRSVARFHKKGIAALFSFDVSQDIKKSDQYISYLAQGGLGLPDRDYYFKEDEKSQKIREEYKQYIVKMFKEYGEDKGIFTADVIMRIETEMARASMTRVERRNMEKQYNKRSLGDIKAFYPRINFQLYFSEIKIEPNDAKEMIVAQPDFFTQLNQSFEIEPLENWKTYLKWKLINGTTSYVSDNISKLSFDFYGTALTGTKEQKPRWKRVVASANNLIGELVAQEYVKVASSPESKIRINKMVDNLRDAFKVRIEKLDWMSEETKKKAIEKLNSFNRKLGYPDKWKDYSRLDIKKDSYVKNFYRANEFAFNEMIEKLEKPIDKSEWEMLPQTVNAYYNPVMNEIVFPAAIMQPPFFNPEADEATNYGAIGAVIGHEFSHGFDDQGSKFDATGNMNNWWTEEDKKKFEERTKVLVNQYNKFAVEDKVFVNGELTLGENIADFAGLTVAYDAYQMYLKDKSRKSIDGFTPEQRFFIGFAQVWKNNARPEYLRQQVMTDPHSPGKFRVLGPLSNMPQFYSAFGIKQGDKMFIAETDRAKIW